ncbi:transmembrane emp24 domain-containing protein 6 isoform X2 [Octopus sinensis]|uniref:Transmembrane emp24 domain-containing protein 6 isoform X2 n=1 Tax=Octopus sinensis TaxID=2607531 RepID=A0A7E6FS62_9MOLL|nr:transmembrane emp24 domain-containing protein 6 isoform X2 [Octopus sinensis]
MRPQGDIAYSQLWQSRGTYSHEESKEGVHEICFDNSYSHFSSKLVNFYFSAYIHGEILQYLENLQQVGVAVANISVYLENVHGHIRQSLADIITSRSHSLVDFYNVSENNSRVQYWSILQCIVIISTSCLQIFFVRRLFQTKDVTPSMKPRA